MRPLQGSTLPLQGAQRPLAAPGRPRAAAAPPRRAARRVRAAAVGEGDKAAWWRPLTSFVGDAATGLLDQAAGWAAGAAVDALTGGAAKRVEQLTSQLQAQRAEISAATATAEQRHAELIAEFLGHGGSSTPMDGRPAASGRAAWAESASPQAAELAAAAAGLVRAYAAVHRDSVALLLGAMEQLDTLDPFTSRTASTQYNTFLLYVLSNAPSAFERAVRRGRSNESSAGGSTSPAPAFLPALDALLAPPPGPPEAAGAAGSGPGGARGGSGEGQQAASRLLDAALWAVLTGEAPEQPAGESFRGSSFPTADTIRCGGRHPEPRLLKHVLAALRNAACRAAVPAAFSHLGG
jgi:hypothetical protein